MKPETIKQEIGALKSITDFVQAGGKIACREHRDGSFGVDFECNGYVRCFMEDRAELHPIAGSWLLLVADRLKKFTLDVAAAVRHKVHRQEIVRAFLARGGSITINKNQSNRTVDFRIATTLAKPSLVSIPESTPIDLADWQSDPPLAVASEVQRLLDHPELWRQ